RHNHQVGEEHKYEKLLSFVLLFSLTPHSLCEWLRGRAEHSAAYSRMLIVIFEVYFARTKETSNFVRWIL
ncbi:hypothetical protein, partial [Brucella gallinifaecis]|uniref:hypothetical protein n=1 Tax=Brucella gallinifaecis TaxID=215590 RepID=UPI002362BA65